MPSPLAKEHSGTTRGYNEIQVDQIDDTGPGLSYILPKSMFLRNVGEVLPYYTASHLRRQYTYSSQSIGTVYCLRMVTIPKMSPFCEHGSIVRGMPQTSIRTVLSSSSEPGQRSRYSDWIRAGRPRDRSSSQEFSLLQIVQTGSEVHPTSYPMGTGGSFPKVKRPRCEADHSRSRERGYIHPPPPPPWRSVRM
jgi:hypothetical protein